MKNKTIIDCFKQHLQAKPDQVAYSFPLLNSSLTYADLFQKASQVAEQLKAICPRGSCVLLFYPTNPDFLVAYFAVIMAQLVPIIAPLPNPKSPGFALDWLHLESIVNNAMPVLCLIDSQLQQMMAQAHMTDLLRQACVQVPQLGQLLQNNDSQFLKLPRHTLQTLDSFECSSSHITDLSKLALIQYTSGSTQLPKGVMVTHESLLSCLESITSECKAVENIINWFPLNHSSGMLVGIYIPMSQGKSSYLFSPFDFIMDPIIWMQAITDHPYTLSGSPNFAYDLCVRKITGEQKKLLDLSRWAIAGVGGERLNPLVMEQFAEAFAECGFSSNQFYSLYGMSETVNMCAGRPWANQKPFTAHAFDALALQENIVKLAVSDDSSIQLVSLGAVMPSNELLIVDPVSKIPLNTNQVGEIWIKGPSVALGYYQQTELTAEAFENYTADGQGPFLATGDLGFMYDEQMYVYGRIKDLIIVRGKNYSPDDIEQVVEHADLSINKNGNCAFALDSEAGEELILLVEINPAVSMSAEELIRKIREQVVGAFSVRLAGIYLLAPGSLSRTNSAKIHRGACMIKYIENKFDFIASTFRDRVVVLNEDKDKVSLFFPNNKEGL